MDVRRGIPLFAALVVLGAFSNTGCQTNPKPGTLKSEDVVTELHENFDSLRNSTENQIQEIKAKAVDDKRKSDEKIALLTAEVRRARVEVVAAWAESAKANERAQALEKEVAEARTRQAQDEKEMAELVQRNKPRMPDKVKFVEILKGLPKAPVEIVYQPEDEEVSVLVTHLNIALERAGWVIVRIRPVSEEDVLPDTELPRWMPLTLRAGAWSYVGLVVKHAPPGPRPCDCAVESLGWAFAVSGVGMGAPRSDPRMPDNLVRLVDGPKTL